MALVELSERNRAGRHPGLNGQDDLRETLLDAEIAETRTWSFYPFCGAHPASMENPPLLVKRGGLNIPDKSG